MKKRDTSKSALKSQKVTLEAVSEKPEASGKLSKKQSRQPSQDVQNIR